MDNVEKRLQAKVKHQITVEKQREERKYIRNKKRLENGTKKIYYTILKEVIRNKKEENVLIDFIELIDDNKRLHYLSDICINNKNIILGKTYFGFDKLKSLLEYYNFNIEYREKIKYENWYYIKEWIDDKEYLTGYITKINAKRMLVCHNLLNTDPNQVIKQDIDEEKTKTYTKQ